MADCVKVFVYERRPLVPTDVLRQELAQPRGALGFRALADASAVHLRPEGGRWPGSFRKDAARRVLEGPAAADLQPGDSDIYGAGGPGRGALQAAHGREPGAADP